MKQRKSFFARMMRRSPRIAVLRLSGVIGGGGRFGRGLEDAALAPLVERAFETPRVKAVALAINSPGGSPTQSTLIAQRIRAAADDAKIPVIAFAEDVAASGGYMLACAADEIYADRNSILGSIGVISASFGFQDAMARLGVERRVQTAGAVKARLDPFQAQKPEDVVWLQSLQARIHENFIAMVKAARGDRLGDDPPDALFSGEVYLGEAAVANGLADGIGRLDAVMKARFGDGVEFTPISPRRSFFERFGPGRAAAPGLDPSALDPSALAAGLAAAAWDEAERRALWSRYGL